MEAWMSSWMQATLAWLALPEHGLGTLFVVSFISATFVPVGSEAAVLGLVALNPSLFWPAIGVATVGNTLGGALNWWIGWGAHKAFDRLTHHEHPARARVLVWLQRFGPKACLLSWLPVVGDPLCGVAGWLKLPFWPCVVYMLIGKFARYVVMTGGLVWMGRTIF